MLHIHLDITVEDLVFCFKIFGRDASKSFTTITIVVVREMKPLIYLPTPEQTLYYKHPHFSSDFNFKLKGLGTVLSNGFKEHQFLKVSIKVTALVKVIKLTRSLFFVPKVVPLIIS